MSFGNDVDHRKSSTLKASDGFVWRWIHSTYEVVPSVQRLALYAEKLWNSIISLKRDFRKQTFMFGSVRLSLVIHMGWQLIKHFCFAVSTSLRHLLIFFTKKLGKFHWLDSTLCWMVILNKFVTRKICRFQKAPMWWYRLSPSRHPPTLTEWKSHFVYKDWGAGTLARKYF